MRHKLLKVRQTPLNLSEALIEFGLLKENPLQYAQNAAKLGQRLVREIQYLHGLIAEIRATLPERYHDYIDPARVDTALARTAVYDK